MFPFSFREYCEYYSEENDKDKLFDEYFMKGGLAGSYAYNTDLDIGLFICNFANLGQFILIILTPYKIGYNILIYKGEE